ncbi:MAG: hypothetical protein EB830_00960 [Nitrosopumilus sp. H13]|nr:MAG: hypothetical protein EB830_00960 [Nitrosopumilus sp. H13]
MEDKEPQAKRYRNVEDLPASVVRQARVGHNTEQAIRDMIGAPCRIIESCMDLEHNESTFEIDIVEDDQYLDSVDLSVYGNNAEMTATRAFSVGCAYNVDHAIRRGSEMPLGELDGYEPKLEISVCEDALIITLSVAGKASDMPKIHRLVGVMRAAEFAMLKS